MKQEHILIVDDEPDIRNLISDILADEGYSVATAANGEEANQQLSISSPSLILLDIWMPDIDGISLMKGWLEKQLVSAPIVMMSGHGTVETAVEATRLGAKDFIEKPLSLAKLLQTVSSTIEQNKTETIIEKTQIIEPIGNSAAIQSVRSKLEKLYQTKNNLLIEGEYGTGKNSIALLIHEKRNGNNSPLIKLDVDTSVDELEKKLTSPSGLFVQAQGGTLVLNNIERLNNEQQKLLTSFLKHKQFTLYGENTVQIINFGLITISQKDISSEVANGYFSPQLFEILSEVRLRIPSLKERPEDVPELLNYFVNTLPDLENTPYRKMSFAAQNLLRNHQWNNNILELKNTVRKLLLLGGEGDISKEEVESLLEQNKLEAGNQGTKSWYHLPLREARDEFEKDYLLHQLEAVDGRVGKLAEVAGMERTHLYRKLRALNINPKEVGKS